MRRRNRFLGVRPGGKDGGIIVMIARDFERGRDCRRIDNGLRGALFAVPPADVGRQRSKADQDRECQSEKHHRAPGTVTEKISK